MKRNLLIVEDDPKIRKMLGLYFGVKYNILEADNGEDAIVLLRSERIDLVFLDLMLPEMDGLQVCRRLRQTSDVPVIMLTAKSQEEDKLLGYECGADEYVTKPFSLKVLDARADALLRRTEGKVSKQSRVAEFSGVRLDMDSGELTVDGNPVTLTRKEHDLLMLLVRNRGQVVSKEQILDMVWGFDYEGDPRTVDTTVKRLREKLGESKGLIQTLRGRGYCLQPMGKQERQ